MGQIFTLPMALNEDKQCKDCMVPSYKEYIEQFHQKYKKEMDTIEKLDNEFTNYYEIHKTDFTKNELNKRMKINDKLSRLRDNLLSKLITNKEYIHMTNVYLQCSKQKCKQYYKEYIRILEITLNIILRELFLVKRQPKKKLSAANEKIYKQLIYFAKSIGIDTDAINKKVMDYVIRVEENRNIELKKNNSNSKKRR
jgi:hypothetical protein